MKMNDRHNHHHEHGHLSPVEAASIFAALGSEQRLSVLSALVRAGPEGLSIGELGTRCGVTGSTLTHHMKLLAAAGLVAQVRQGRSVICVAAEYETMRGLADFLLRECCADARCLTAIQTEQDDHDHDHASEP